MSQEHETGENSGARARRRAWVARALGEAAPAAAAVFAFFATAGLVSVRDGLWQLFAVLAWPAVAFTLPVGIIYVWIRRRVLRWTMLVPTLACGLAIPLGKVSGEAHHAWYFERYRLPAYERFIEAVRDGRVPLDTPLPLSEPEVPPYLMDDVYLIHVHKSPASAPTVEFFFGGGFPVKHAAHVYRPSDELADLDWWAVGAVTKAGHCPWGTRHRVAPKWFITID